MKYSFFYTLLLAAALCQVSCTLDKEYRPGDVSPVSSLISPEDGMYVRLQSGTGAATTFEWSPAYAQDGMDPQYEVVFYASEDGDIVYRVDAGFNTSVSIVHKELNKAASAAGIPTGEDGTMYWAVVASRGISESAVAVTPRKLEVTRLLGFETIPTEVYITGEGSETGSDLSAAYKAITGSEEGMFTFYHRLKAGQGFTFTSSKAAEHTTYTVVDGILDDQSSTPATVTEDGIYKISLDFNVRGISIEPITNVLYNFADDHTRNMDYIGNGTWKLSDYTVEFLDKGYEEDRYHFRATIGGTEMVWGYEATDSNRPGTLTGSYFYIYEHVWDGNRWAYPYKFMTDLNGSTVDITVCMNGDVDHPTHVIDNIR